MEQQQDYEIKVVNMEETALNAQNIKDMIDQLSVTEEGESLRNAMQDLKKALLKNPSACAMLLPEDIGEMVKYLMKITGKDIENQMSGKAKKGPKPKPFDFTDEKTLKELEDNLF